MKRKKKMNPWISGAVKLIFALLFLSNVGTYEETGPKVIALLLGLGLIFWAAWPFLRKKQAPAQAVSGNRNSAPQPIDTSDDVVYPFENLGMGRAFEPQDFIVLDTETTGFSPREDKIIEFAALKVQNGKATRFCSLVNPGRRIPKRSQAIHGITDTDVGAAPSFAQLLPELDAFLDPSLPIIGQNVLFDLRFLWWEYHDAGRDIGPRQFIDTYKLAKKAFPGRESYSLATLIHDYHLIEGEQTHRSESDVDATYALYRLCCDTLGEK